METKKDVVKAVTFDLWETLICERDGESARRMNARCMNLQEALRGLGVTVSVEQLEQALKRLVSTLLKVWETNRDVPHLEQIQLIMDYLSEDSLRMKKEWADELAEAYISPIFEVPPYLNPEAFEVLELLKKRDMLVGLICNTGLTPGIGLRKLLMKEGIAKFFDLMIFSDEVGIRKPDPEIFCVTTRRLGVDPSEAVHIGDNLKCDVLGAQNAGLKAILLSCEEGHDKIAQSDPSSLISLSRKLDDLGSTQVVPDKTVKSLGMVLKTLEEWKK